MPSGKEIVRSGYDKIAGGYLAARSTDTQDIRLLDDLLERLPGGAPVLDAGCGPGVPVTRILRRKFDVTGLDFSREQIGLARRSVPEARYVCADMANLPFAAGAFDAIVSYYAIIHIPREEHEKVLRGFHRALRPSGLALLCMGMGDLPAGAEDDWLGAPMYWSHYDAATNLEMLRACGFEVVWSAVAADALDSGGHLFVLARKG